MPGKDSDLADVGFDRSLGVIAQAQVVDEALAQRSHEAFSTCEKKKRPGRNPERTWRARRGVREMWLVSVIDADPGQRHCVPRPPRSGLVQLVIIPTGAGTTSPRRHNIPPRQYDITALAQHQSTRHPTTSSPCRQAAVIFPDCCSVRRNGRKPDQRTISNPP